MRERSGRSLGASAVGGIEGIVIDSLGYLFSDVVVSVVGSQRVTTSNLDGAFRFERLPEGTYRVIAYMKNVTNEAIILGLERTDAQHSNMRIGGPDLPRTFGVELHYRF